MKIAALIARILLGLLFFVFGLNGFLHFIPMGPMPTGVAGDFSAALRAAQEVKNRELRPGMLERLAEMMPK